MPITDHKITSFSKKVVDLTDVPSENMSPADIKAWFDSSPEELRVKHNSLINDLNNNVPGWTYNNGNHQGAWQGLTPQMIGAPEMNSARITAAELQLAQTDQKLIQTEQIARQDGYETNAGLALSRQPLATFISDDINIADYSTEVKSIFINHGIPCVLAAIPGRIEANDPNTMTYAQLKEMQDVYGYEITSHTLTHQYTTTLTEAEIDNELKTSRDLLNANGLKCKNVCMPYGDYNDTVKKIAQKYYRGVRVSGHRTNPYPIDNLNIHAMSSEFNDDYPSENLDACKVQVDNALANNQWLVFLFHAWSQTPESLANLDALITYIKSKSIDIVTMDKALDVYGTAMQVGTKGEFKVGKDGVIYSKQGAIYYQSQDSVSSTNPISDYFPNHLNICNIIGNKAAFPEGIAGTLLTYNYKSDEVGFQWQEYYLFNSPNVYRRRLPTNGIWTAWDYVPSSGVMNTTITKTKNEYTGNTLPSALPSGKVIHTSVSANSLGMPTTSAGLLIINTTGLLTSGASDYGMVTQEYTKYGTNEKWVRTATSGTAWTTWQKITVV